MRTFEVVLLVYLTVSEHFLSVTARRATLETGSGHGGIKAVTDLIYSPPQRQKYRYKEKKCRKPYSKEDRDGMCKFYLCDHMRNRRKIEDYKNFLASKGALREKDFLKGIAKYMHGAHRVALKGAKLQCSWGERIGDEFAVWGEKLLPGAYGCIRKAMEIQAGKTQTKCKEGFTREFEGRLRKSCSDRFDQPNQEDAAPWSSLPGPARGGGDEGGDELDLRLQEPEQAAVGLEEAERGIAEEEEEDLLGLGDDGDDASDFADFLRASGSDPAASDGSGEDWWDGLVVGPPQPESEPSPQSGGVPLGDLLAPTPADHSTLPAATRPPHYVDPMSLYGTAAATNSFLQPGFGGGEAPAPPAYTFPNDWNNQPYPAVAASSTNPFLQPSGVRRQPAEGFTRPAFSWQHPPHTTQPAAPPTENSGWSFAATPSETGKTKDEDLFADLVW